MKIYTKTGDKGQTGLYSGKRLSKAHIRVEAYGTVDELNSFVGLLRDHVSDESIRTKLLQQQNLLFALGAAMADDRPGEAYRLPAEAAPSLETDMDLLPGGHPAVSYTHVCRTICRRAERRTVELADSVELDPSIVVYLNRLSDWFFVLGRYLSLKSGVEEIKWIS